MNIALLLITNESNRGKQLKSILTQEGVLVNLISNEEQLNIAQSAPYGLVIFMNGTYSWDVLNHLNNGELKVIPKMMIGSLEHPQPTVDNTFIESIPASTPCEVIIGKILRFFNIPHETVLCAKDLTLHTTSRSVMRNGVSIRLTNKEFQLLQLLLERKGRVVSKEEISREIWNINFETGTNTIEVYINFLRNKVDRPFGDKLIYTKSGFGYIIKEDMNYDLVTNS